MTGGTWNSLKMENESFFDKSQSAQIWLLKTSLISSLQDPRRRRTFKDFGNLQASTEIIAIW